MLSKNNEKIFFSSLVVISLLFLCLSGYQLFTCKETLSNKERSLSSLQRQNFELLKQIDDKKQKIQTLSQKIAKVNFTTKRFKPFNSPELIGKTVTRISIRNNTKISLLTSEVEEKEKFLIKTTIALQGAEANVIEAIKEILDSFPLSLEDIQILKEKEDTELQMTVLTPIVQEL